MKNSTISILVTVALGILGVASTSFAEPDPSSFLAGFLLPVFIFFGVDAIRSLKRGD